MEYPINTFHEISQIPPSCIQAFLAELPRMLAEYRAVASNPHITIRDNELTWVDDNQHVTNMRIVHAND